VSRKNIKVVFLCRVGEFSEIKMLLDISWDGTLRFSSKMESSTSTETILHLRRKMYSKNNTGMESVKLNENLDVPSICGLRECQTGIFYLREYLGVPSL